MFVVLRGGGGGGGNIPLIVFVRVVHEACAVGEDGCVFEEAVCGGGGGGWVFGSILLAKDVFS